MSNRDIDDEPVETRNEHDPNPGEQGKGLSAVIAALGLWMIVQAVLFDLVATQMWNDIIVGALLAAVGAYNYYRRSDEQLGNLGAAAVAALLGLWLIVAPFVLGADTGFTEAANDLGFWNDIVVGLLVLAAGAYSAYKIRDRRSDARRTAA